MMVNFYMLFFDDTPPDTWLVIWNNKKVLFRILNIDECQYEDAYRILGCNIDTTDCLWMHWEYPQTFDTCMFNLGKMFGLLLDRERKGVIHPSDEFSLSLIEEVKHVNF